MKFIIDAHLPKRVAAIFKELGHEAIHTSELPQGNASKDKEIVIVAGDDGVVISKDDDFYNSFLLHRKPVQFVYVKVGNMRLRDLTALFQTAAPKLIDLLGQHDMLELHKDKIIVIA
jgi:predicted nuclease of predicted toxin-antitoxin system